MKGELIIPGLILLFSFSLLAQEKLAIKSEEGGDWGDASLWLFDAGGKKKQLLAEGGIYLEGKFVDPDHRWIVVMRKFMSHTQGVYFFVKNDKGVFQLLDTGMQTEQCWQKFFTKTGIDPDSTTHSLVRLESFDAAAAKAKLAFTARFPGDPGEATRIFEIDLKKSKRVPAPLQAPLSAVTSSA